MERKLWTPQGDVPVSKPDSGVPPRVEATDAQAGPPPGTGAPADLTDEQVAEIRQALEQLRQIPVEELLLNEINTLAQVAQLHLRPEELDQARLAIDAVRALATAAEERFPEDLRAQLAELLNQLQLAYVQVASAARTETGPAAEDTGDDPEA